MALFRPGRIGYDATLRHMGSWRARSREAWEDSVSGQVIGVTFEEAKVIRENLLAQTGKLIALTYDYDDMFDGFYYQRGADVDVSHGDASMQGLGNFPFDLSLERVGTSAEVLFESLMVSAAFDDPTAGTDAHGLTDLEVKFGHSPPRGALNYSTGLSAPTPMLRDTEFGTIAFYYGLGQFVSPRWAAKPLVYYQGSAALYQNGFVRTGKLIRNDPADWVLTNDALRITPGVTGVTSNGRIGFQVWDGTAWSTVKYFRFLHNGTAIVPEWHDITVLRNDAECVTIKLSRDAEEAPATTNTHELEITLRRGYLFADCYYIWTGPVANWTVERDTAEAAATVTPAGASSAVGIRASANDGDGDQYVLFSGEAFTAETTQGGLDFVSTAIDNSERAGSVFGFGIGISPDGSGAVTGSGTSDLALQFSGYSEEHVRSVAR